MLNIPIGGQIWSGFEEEVHAEKALPLCKFLKLTFQNTDFAQGFCWQRGSPQPGGQDSVTTLKASISPPPFIPIPDSESPGISKQAHLTAHGPLIPWHAKENLTK